MRRLALSLISILIACVDEPAVPRPDAQGHAARRVDEAASKLELSGNAQPREPVDSDAKEREDPVRSLVIQLSTGSRAQRDHALSALIKMGPEARAAIPAASADGSRLAMVFLERCWPHSADAVIKMAKGYATGDVAYLLRLARGDEALTQEVLPLLNDLLHYRDRRSSRARFPIGLDELGVQTAAAEAMAWIGEPAAVYIPNIVRRARAAAPRSPGATGATGAFLYALGELGKHPDTIELLREFRDHPGEYVADAAAEAQNRLDAGRR